MLNTPRLEVSIKERKLRVRMYSKFWQKAVLLIPKAILPLGRLTFCRCGKAIGTEMRIF